MPNKTDPLSGDLNAPSTYQRPVATRSSGVDVFGQAAGLLNGIDSATSAGRKASGPSVTEQQNLLVKQGMDEYAQGVAEIMTGSPAKQSTHGFDVSVLETYGADVQSSLAEMKRIQDSQEQGGTTRTLAEVQIEKLTNGIMGRHPELSYEIMGEGMAKLGIDHSYARNFKALQAMGDLADAASRDAAKHYADIATQAGITVSGMPFVTQVAKGQELAAYNEQIRKGKEEREIQAAATKADADGLKLTRELQDKQDEKIDDLLVEGRLGLVAVQQDSVVSMFYNNKYVGADDAGVSKDISDTIDVAIARLNDSKQAAIASMRADGVKAKGITRAEAWFDAAQKHLEDIRSGSGANYNLQSANLKMLNDLKVVNSVDVVPTLNTLNSMFGKEMVTNILMGTMPGFPPETVKGLRDELLGAFEKAQGDQAKITKAALDFKANLSGANIHNENDPVKRAKAAQQAAFGLWGSVGVMAKPGSGTTASQQVKDTFINTSTSLAGLALQEGVIMTPEAAGMATDLLFNKRWVGSMYEYAKTADPSKVDMGVRYNGVAAGSTLDAMKSQFINRGLVEYDKTTGRYVPVKDFSLHPALSDMPKRTAAANTMNKLLDHLVSLDGLGGVQLVPTEALVSKDAEGKVTKLSLREVFATTDGLQQSLLNWGNNQQKAEQLDAIAQAHATLSAYRKGEGLQDPDFSKITRENVALNLDTAEIESLMPKYSGSTYIPVNSLQEFKASIGGAEAGGRGNIGAHNPERSSAYGLYGFLDGTWVNTVRQIPGMENLSEADALALRKDRAIESRVMDIFTTNNIKALRNNLGRDVSWDEVNMAHLLGAGKGDGASSFLMALALNPSMKTKDFFKGKNKKGEIAVIAANPELTGNGDATLLQMWNNRLNRTDASWAAYMQQSHGISADVPKTNWTGDLSGDDIELPLPN